MKLFIFGAGASRGSTNKNVDNNKYQAPLANELLNSVYEEYAEELSLDINYLRATFERTKKDRSLEDWLSELWKYSNQGGEGYTAEAAISLRGDLGKFAHYLRWMFQTISTHPGNNSLYKKLLIILREETQKDIHHAFINFNYDTLFDIAFTKVWSRPLDNVDSYITQKILKPHGSVNWLGQKRQEDGGIPGKSADNDWQNRYRFASVNLFKGSGLALTDYKYYDPGHNFLQKRDSIYSQDFGWDYFQPLIFLPLSEKIYSHIPELGKKIEEGAKTLFPNVSQIFLIGYQANDELIHDWIEKYTTSKPPILHVVSNSVEGATEIMERVIKRHPKKLQKGKVFFDPSNTSFKNGFKTFVENYNKI